MYRPSPSVTAARVFSMSTGLLASTVTPGSTAPLVSRTMPLKALCALAAAGRQQEQTKTVNPKNSPDSRDTRHSALPSNMRPRRNKHAAKTAPTTALP